ncbi:MAG: peptidylprolyl isomerase [Bacteroidota bacterium]|nr:peptidylprolyl isomerase [Bacteroidota bacterium]
MRRNLLALSLSIVACGASAQTNDPVIMKINGKEIKKSEFEYIYNKNNSATSMDKKSLGEYMVLFKNFKLKVIEAEKQGLDTTKSFVNELSGYRRQLAQPYLTDKSADDKFAREAYDRMKENVEVSHILIRLPENPTSADTLAAYNKLMDIRKQLVPAAFVKGGKAAKQPVIDKNLFAKLAEKYSEDPSKAENKGYLGYISSFMTVYPFELAAYNTSVGQVSKPIRTDFGYHLILVHSRRQDPGQVLVAHIMKAVKPKNDSIPADIAEADAKNEIQAIYNELRKGEDFSRVASVKSDDRGSAAKGGELPWFGINRMIKEFENTAFSLKNKGDISGPFKTRFGWHIVKLLDKKGLEPFEDKKAEIVRMFMRDQRAEGGKDMMIARLKKEYNLTEDAAALNEMIALADKAGFPSDSAYQVAAAELTKPIFKVDGKAFTQKEFAATLKGRSSENKKSAADFIRNNYNEYVDNSVLSYEDSKLESKYPEFRNLMQEYHDGMLLFEISNREVWDKASKDNEGLKKYFEQNKANYNWNAPKYKGLIVYCKDKETVKKAQSIIKKTGSDSVVYVLRKALNDSVTRVKVEKGLFAKGENKVVDAKAFKGAEYIPDSQYPYYFTVGKVLTKGPEEYADVRGLVTADYQNYLEEKWIKDLNDKYKVEINEAVLKTVKQ